MSLGRLTLIDCEKARERAIEAYTRMGAQSEFHHQGGFWPMNVTLEDRRCGYDPYNHRGRGAYRKDSWS
jgi:hypothetical protein